jgi:peptide/nickel transport system substrate-binding protein
MSDAIRFRRLAAIAACLFSIAAFVSACGGSSSSNTSASGASATSSSSSSSTQAAGTPKSGGSITDLLSAGFAGDWPAGLDPATNVNGAANQSQMNSIYGQLWQLTEQGTLRPDLATAYKFSNGGKTVTITIRSGVKFTDGTPFNAQAVAANWKRDLATPCTCKPVIPVKTITAPNDTTVVVNLAAPDGAFVNQLQDSNFSWIASLDALKKMGESAFKLKPVGAGPFIVESDTPSNSLVLKKNPNYWNSGHPYLDGLTFKTTAGDESALEAIQAGQGNAYEGMTTKQLINSFKSAGATVTQEPSTSPYDIQFNTKIPPFNDKRARLAIYYATDAALLDQKLFDNQYPVGQSFTAPAGLFYEKTVPGYPEYDLAKAKQLVQQLGGLKVNYFTITQPQTQNMMVAMQQMYKAAGIQASIHFYGLAALIQQFQGPWQMAFQTAGAWDPAGGVGLGFRFLSASPFSGVHDPKLDALILGGQAAVDPAARKKEYDAAAAYIAQNAYGPFLFPISGYNVAKGAQGPGLTTPIASIAVNPNILWEDVSTS